MLNPAEFVARCIQCLEDEGNRDGIPALTRLALASQRENPGAWGHAEVLHCSDDLMIVDLNLPPFATSPIHEHGTWAVIGISAGCEIDDLLVERDGGLQWTARHELRSGDILALQPDCIHFISNPLAVPSRGIHVYGKNLGLTNRRMWDPVTCRPQPMDFAVFEQWEGALTARSTAAGVIVAPVFDANPRDRVS